MASRTWLTATFVVFVGVLITFASSHEGHHKNGTVAVNETQAADDEYKVDPGLREPESGSDPTAAVDNYEWNSPDEGNYPSEGGDNQTGEPPQVANNSQELPEDEGNEEATTTLNHIMEDPSNDIVSNNETEEIPAQSLSDTDDQNAQLDDQQSPPSGNETEVNDSDDNQEEISNTAEELPPIEGENNELESENTTEEPSDNEETVDDDDESPPGNTDDEEENIPQSTFEDNSDTTRIPSPVVSEDVGDSATNYNPPKDLNEENESVGLRAWAVVTVSVLVSFTVIFTILYFIRSAMIRRRKADQRRLLRGSVSAEGYFYGDGEAHTSGKFEL